MQLEPIAETSPLDTFYYVANFETMLRTLQRRDGDLLSAEEGAFIREFFLVPQVSRALLVRMLMRKGPLFRAARLNYREIPRPIAAAQPLLERGWIDPTPTMTLAEVFGIFTKAEVAVRLVVEGFEKNVSKCLLLESLLMRWPDARPLDAWLAPPEPVFKVAVANLCIRLQLMFFGNFRQSLTDFVLATLGLVKYEGTGFEPHSRPFQTRAQVEHFFALYRCRQMLHEDRLPADVEPLLPPPIDGCEWLEDRRQKLHYRLARQYERSGALGPALAIYTTCTHPDARTRAARLSRANQGLGRPRRPPAAVPIFDLTLPRSASLRPVECRVSDELLAGEGTESCVYYVENSLINSLFGLMCWSAIFAPVRGAFFHPFQREPADLMTAGFFERRGEWFAACFAELHSGTYRATILDRFAMSHGIAAPFVAWGAVDESLLRMALDCFPPEHLRLWFMWIICDIRHHRSGFPDLVQFWPRSRRYRMVEVKGPGDRLQENQRRCLEYLCANAIPASVCRVRWS